MKRFAAAFAIISCLLTASLERSWGQSLIPQGTGYLAVTGATTQGDSDDFMVAFFEIPDTVSGPIYFSVESPGMEDSDSSSATRVNGDDSWLLPAENYSYHLVGGIGTLSGTGARNQTFADLDAARTGGTLLSTIASPTEFPTGAAGWYSFPAVYASQGEHIGNKYYFKVIAQAPATSMAKNGFRLDVSYTSLAGTGSPAQVNGVRAFAFTWTINQIDGVTYDLFPFVPNSATGNLMAMNHDMDGGGTVDLFDISGPPSLGSPDISASGVDSDRATSAFPIGGEVNGTWQLTIVDGGGVVSDGLNMTEFWFEGDYNGDTAFNGADEYLRTYAALIPAPVAPDHVELSPNNQTVISGAPADAYITMQITDAASNPLPYAQNVRVQVAGAAAPTVNGIDNDEVVTTNGDGLATFFIQQTGAGVATVTLETNGGGGGDDNFGAGADDGATVTFQADVNPVPSSVSNTTFAENAASPQNLANLVVTDTGAANIADATDLRVVLPAGLGAIFDNTIATVTVTGANVGTWNVTYADVNRTAIIDTPAVYNTGATTFAGLRLASPYTVSSGSLGISWDGDSVADATDDKVINITSQYITYVWNGTTSTDWATAANWTPNGVPDLATEDALVPFIGAAANYPVAPAVTVRNLTIDAGASVSLGAGNLTIGGTFQNNGTLILTGAGRASQTDANSGTTRYTAAGAIADFGATDYYDLDLAPGVAATFTTTAALNVARNLTIGANATLDIAGLDLAAGGTFTNNGRLHLNGGAGQTLSAPTNAAGSTVRYYGGTAGLSAGATYVNLEITAGTRTAASAITVTGTATVSAGATLDLGANDFTIATLDNEGIVQLTGTQATHAITTTDVNSGTFAYTAAGAATIFDFGATDYFNLTVSGAGTFAAGALTIAGAYTQSAGTVAAGGDWAIAGAFDVTDGSVTAAAPRQITAATIALGTVPAGPRLDAGANALTLNAAANVNVALGAAVGAFSLTNAELAKIAAGGLSINASGTGTIAADAVNTTGAAHGTLTLANTQALTFTGTNSFSGGLAAATTLAAGISLGGAVELAGAAGTTVNLGRVGAGAASLTITADEIGFTGGAGTVAGTGALVLRTATTTQAINLGGAADAGAASLDLTAADLAAIAGGGFASLTIGRDGDTGLVAVAAATAAALPPLVLEGADGTADLIRVDFGLQNTTAGATISFRAPTRLGADVTTNNGAVVFERATTVADGVTATIATGGGNLTFQAAATLNGNAGAGNETLTLNAGAGVVALGAAIGATQPLYDLTIGSGAALALPAVTVANNLNATTTVGGISDGGTLTVPGTATFAVPVGQIILLDVAASDFGTVAFTQGLDASVVDANGLAIGASTLGGALTVTAGGAITDSGALAVSGAAVLTTTAANGAITLNNANAFGATLALTTNGTGNASVTNVTGNLALAASVVGGDLTVQAAGAAGITDTGNLQVTGNASFTVANGASIILDSAGNVFTGATLAFAASVGTIADLTLVDTTAVRLPAVTITGNLNVSAGGLLDQSGALVVAGTTTLAAGTNAITLSNVGNDFGGTLAFTNAGANDVQITDLDDLALAASTTGGALTVIAGGAITDTGALTVTGAAVVETRNDAGADITIDDDGAPYAGNFGSVALRSMDAAGAAIRGGAVTLREASATVLDAVRTSGTATIQSAGTVTDAAGAMLEATPLVLVSVGGTTLDSINSAISSINITNTGGGTIAAASTAALLTVTGVSQTGAGDLTLSADDLAITGGIGAGTNAVNLYPYTTATPIFLGGAGAGLQLSDAELDLITTSGTLTIGRTTQTGGITVNGDIGLSGPTGPVNLLTDGGAITVMNAFATAAVAGANLTLDARVLATTGTVTGAGQITAGSGGAANLTVDAGAGINLSNAGNAANAVALTNSTGGNIAYNNNRNMTLSAANSAANGTIAVANATGTLTVTGPVTTAGAGGANISLSAAGAIAVNSGITAAGTGFVTLLVAGATQTAVITAPGGLRLGGTGTFTLTQNNVVTTVAAAVTGPLSFTAAGAIDVGAVDTVNGITITGASTLTLVAAGAVTQTQPIITVAGTLVLTNTTADTDLSTQANQIATFGTITATGRTVQINNTIASTQSGAIAATSLRLIGTAGYTWTTATNNVTTLAAAIGANPLSYRDTNAVAIGAIGPTNGVAANAFTLTAGGAVTQSQPITLGAGTLTVSTLNNAGANITLNGVATNEAAVINLRTRDAGDAADAAGTVAYRDATGFDVTALRTTAGATLQGGGTATDDLSQSGDIVVGGTLTVIAGLGDAVFNRATNALATVATTSAAALTLNDANGYTLGASTTTGAITASTAAGGLVVTGALSTAGAAGAGIDLNPAAGGTITLSFNGTVAATNGGLVRFRRAVALTQNTTIDTDVTLGVTAGGAVQFDAGISGSFALTVDASADGGGANGLVTATGAIATLASLSLTGDLALNGGTFTTTGAQTYNGPTTLGADTTFTANAGNLVRFNGTLGGGGTARAIAVATANARFDQAVGGAGNLVSTLSVGGTTALYANVTTTGTQTYTGTATLNANVALIAGAGAINLATVVEAGARTLTLQDGAATGTVTLAGPVTLTGLAFGAGNYNVAMTGTGSAITNLVEFLNQGTLSLGAAAGTITFNGGVETTGNATNPSLVTLRGTIGASDDAIILGAITLGADTTVDANSTAAIRADISIGAVTLAGFNLTLSTGAAIANADLTVASVSGAGTLALADIGGTATFAGAVTATALTVPNTVAALALNGASGTITNAVTFQNTGTLSLGAAGGTLTFNGGLSTAAVGLTVTTYGTILTSDDAITLGAFTLGADTVLDTAATTAAGAVTIGAVTNGGAFRLTITTGASGGVTQSGGVITATYLRIVTGGAIGTAGTPLAVDVDFFEASAGGLVNVSNDGAMTIGFAGAPVGVSSATGAVTIASDDLTITEAITGTATLTLQPRVGGTTVSIGAGGGAFALDDAELALLTNGFTAVTLGRATSAAVTVTTASFLDPVTILGGGTITIAAGTPSLQTTQDNAGITLTASGAAIVVNGGITANGSGAVDLNSGAAFTLAEGIAIASGTGPITIDTAGAANDMTLNGSVATGGAGTVLLTASRSILMDADSSITTNAGTITLDADAVAAGSLTLDVVQSSGGAQITLRCGSGGAIGEADDTALVSTSGLLHINDAAAGGSIGGAGAARLNTNVGTVRVAAAGNVYLNETNALTVGDGIGGVSASAGLIDILAGGAVTVTNTVATTGAGTTVTLSAPSLALGANVSAIGGNSVSLTSSTGAITRTAGTLSTTGSLALNAATAIGADAGADGAVDASWVATDVATLRATAANGGIFISETSGIALGDGLGAIAATNGDILIAAGGAVTTGNTITATGAGTDIAVTAGGTITLSNNIQAGATMTFDSVGNTTVNAGTITGGSGLILFQDPVVHSGGTIVAGSLTAGNDAIRFTGNYSGTGGTLNGNGAQNPDIAFQGTVVLGTYNHNGDRIRFYGGGVQNFTPSAQALDDVRVEKSGGSVTLLGSATQEAASGALTFVCSGATAFNLNGFTWTLGATCDVNANVTFNVLAGTLDGGATPRGLTVSGTGVLVHTTGTLDLASLTHTSTGASSLGTGVVTVSGALGVSGTGSLTQTGDNGGNAQSLGSVSVTGGTLRWDAGAAGGTLAVTGLIAASGGTLDLNDKTVTAATFAVTGSANLDLATADLTLTGAAGANTINTSGTITDAGSILTLSGAGASLTLDNDERIGDLTINAAGITLTDSGAAPDVDLFVVNAASGASVATGGTLQVNGTTSLAGALTGAGTASVTSGAALTLSGAGSVTMGTGTLTVSSGGMTLTGTGGVSSAGTGANAIAVTGNLAWTSSSSNLSITGGGALSVSGNLTMDAASTGGATVAGGGILIGGNLTKSAGTNGDIVSSGDVAISGQLTNYALLRLSGADLTVSGAGANTNAAGATIETTVSGTQSYTGSMTNAGTVNGYGLVTFNAAVSGAGTINAGPVAANNDAIRFLANYTGGTLNGNGTTNPDISFQANVVLGTYNHNGDRFVFSGGSSTTFDSNGQAIADVVVDKSADGLVLQVVTSDVTQRGTALTITRGVFDLATDGRGWIMDSGAGTPTADTFTGRNGTLSLDSNTAFLVGSFASEATHTISNLGPNTVTASGDVSILGTFSDAATYIPLLRMSGAGPATLTATPPIGELRLLSGASVLLGSALSLSGDMTIEATARLDVDAANSYAITVAGDWNNQASAQGAQQAAGAAGFAARNGTVTFTKPSGTLAVQGTNTWFRFVCDVDGLTIAFSNNPDVQFFVNTIHIESSSALDPITLTRFTDNGDPLSGGTNPARPAFRADSNRFWDISVLPGAALEMDNVDVYYSNADLNPIIAPESVTIDPYYNATPPPASHFNYKWLSGLTLVYSYTEDSDRNGKIDRIRVQAAAAVGNNFSGFQATVAGYTITGYSRPVSGPNFYILLEEKTYPDTDAIPEWNILTNTTLYDEATGTQRARVITDPKNMIPVDTAQPRIAYTLALPERAELFVRSSEPLFDTGPAIAFSTSGPGVGSATVLSTGGDYEWLLNLGAPIAVSALAAGSTTVTVANARDNELTVITPPLPREPYFDQFENNPAFPRPTFPTAYGDYTAYDIAVDVGGAGLVPPNRADGDAATHRATDVLISVPPATALDTAYFIWPVWARDSVTTETAAADYELLTPAEAAAQTIGLIRDFTATQWLRDQDITLEARVNPALGTPTAARLHFDTNVADSFRAESIHGPVGLWLPVFDEGAYSGIVPIPNAPPDGSTSTATGTNVSGALWDFPIDAGDPKVRSVSTLDFFFTLDAANAVDPLYAGRLDIAPGAVVPADWYRRVLPFSFEIHDVKLQRGNVTILNNVIDPTKGETTRVSYQLARSGRTVIQVFTLDGDLVKILYRGTRSSGDYTAVWDGKNQSGRAVARGIYFIRVVGPEIDEIRKVLVVKE